MKRRYAHKTCTHIIAIHSCTFLGHIFVCMAMAFAKHIHRIRMKTHKRAHTHTHTCVFRIEQCENSRLADEMCVLGTHIFSSVTRSQYCVDTQISDKGTNQYKYMANGNINGISRFCIREQRIEQKSVEKRTKRPIRTQNE